MKTKYISGPKRRVERVINQINHNVTSAGVVSAVLYTVEDRKTLVRCIV